MENKKEKITVSLLASLAEGLALTNYAYADDEIDWETYEPTEGDDHPDDGEQDEVDHKTESTPTPTPESTPTPTPESTPTPTPTPSATPTPTPESTPTPTPTISITPTPTPYIPKTGDNTTHSGSLGIGIGLGIVAGAIVLRVVEARKAFVDSVKKENENAKKRVLTKEEK